MFTGYVVVSVLLAVMLAGSSTLDFVRYKQILVNMAKADVSESWVTILGILKQRARLGCWSASACC